MSTWQYIVSKIWLGVCHPKIRMSRYSLHSAGKGWLVNLSLPVNRFVTNYTKEDAVMLHTQLEVVAIRLAWMLGSDDAIQFVSGEDATPRQFYKQLLTRNSDGEVKVSRRQTIHGA